VAYQFVTSVFSEGARELQFVEKVASDSVGLLSLELTTSAWAHRTISSPFLLARKAKCFLTFETLNWLEKDILAEQACKHFNQLRLVLHSVLRDTLVVWRGAIVVKKARCKALFKRKHPNYYILPLPSK
jgi:hypothetical protein